MTFQQPYGQQPLPQPPYQQPPNPYRPQTYGQPAVRASAGPEPSGVTAITAAVLGLLVAFAWVGGVVGIFSSLTSFGMDDVLGALVTVVVLALPALTGAIGVLARTKFGRVMLIVGLALALPVAGLMAFAPDAPYKFGVPVLVGAVAGIVLASVSTTGRYIRAAKRYSRPRQQHPVPQGYDQPGYPPPPQVYQQPVYPQAPVHPQQPGMPPRY